MSDLGSSLGSTQDYIPVVPSTQRWKYAGLPFTCPVLSDGVGDAAGSLSLLSAIKRERVNITTYGTGIWPVGQTFTVGAEPVGVYRAWFIGTSGPLSHGRTVVIRPGLSVVLNLDTNVVTAVSTSGATPSGGNAGDLAIDYAGNAYWLNVSGTWTSQGAIYASGSASVQTGALTASTSQAPNATAVMNAISALSGGTPTRIAANNTVPMNVAGAGNAMPATATSIKITSATTIVPGATVDFGSNTAVYAAVAALTLSGFNSIIGPSGVVTVTSSGGVSTGVIAAGNLVLVSFTCISGFTTAIVNSMGTVATTAPTFGTPVMSGSSITIPVTSTDIDSIAGAASNIHLVFTTGTTKTVSAVAFASGQITGTLSAASTYGDVATVAIDAGFMVDPATGLSSAALSATAVTNNDSMPVPNAPTVVDGSNTTTSIVGTITAPSSGPTPTSYQLYYKLHSASTYTTGSLVTYTGSSTAFSITGLASSSSATSYDVYATAIDTTGPSAASVVMTSSLVATSSSIPTTVANTAFPANPYDVTAAAFDDWYTVRGGQLAFSYHKAGANLITVAAGSNLASVNGNGGAPTISWDGTDAVDNDGAQSAGNSGGNSVNFTVTNTALAADLDISVANVPNGVECELWLAGYIGDPSTVATAIGQLSESGANVATLSVGGSVGFWYARFLFKASTTGASFNAILRQGANSPSALCFAQALYKTGVSS